MKVTAKQVEEYTIRHGTKEYIVRKCRACGCSRIRFTVCLDGTVNKVTSCGCSSYHVEHKTDWKEVAKWFNHEGVYA